MQGESKEKPPERLKVQGTFTNMGTALLGDSGGGMVFASFVTLLTQKRTVKRGRQFEDSFVILVCALQEWGSTAQRLLRGVATYLKLEQVVTIADSPCIVQIICNAIITSTAPIMLSCSPGVCVARDASLARTLVTGCHPRNFIQRHSRKLLQ